MNGGGDAAWAFWRCAVGKRGVWLLRRLVESGGSGVRVRRLGGDRAGEIRLTRFVRNEAVRIGEMMATARARLAGAVAGRHVLAIQDTTVTRSGGGGGSYFHAMIAVDAESGALLGAVDARFLYRTQGRRSSRRQRGFADRQSARWLASAQAAAQACGSALQVTVIADREADVFELFAERPVATELLIRATHDRVLNDGGKLFARARTWPCAGFAELDLPAIALAARAAGTPGHPLRASLCKGSGKLCGSSQYQRSGHAD